MKRVSKAKVLRNAFGDGMEASSSKDKDAIRLLMTNASLMRSTLLNKLIDDRRDIDQECGYPKELTTEQYKLMYDREGIATRVVNVFPEESWSQDPEVRETEDPTETEFEKAVKELDDQKQLWSYLFKIDDISGIGRFGVVLLGLDDGKPLSDPVDGIDEKGEKVGNVQHDLLFLRVFDESLVTIKELEKDVNNPRYGKPVLYTITFDSITKSRTDTGEISTGVGKEHSVHWSRLIHIADNRRSSEVYGVPRMQTLFNRLYDLRKIMGGSGEMFWKGGFPGYSFEMDPNATVPEVGSTEYNALRDQIVDYANGLQRYLTVQGINVKSLAPQVATPKAHVEVQLEVIAIAMGVPKRVFMGSEQGKLAAGQDTKAWNKRISRRQSKYLTPYVVRPIIDRLIMYGILPEPKTYDVIWPDLDSPSELDKAEVLDKVSDALAKYVKGGVAALIPAESFLSMFVGLEPEQVKEIMDAALEREKELEEQAKELEGEEEEETPPAPGKEREE